MGTLDPPSPCIGVCRLDATRQFCVGCYRTIEEISGWLRFSAEEKRRVLARLAQRNTATPAERESASAEATTTRCPRCGTEFVCGRTAEAASCWCYAVPHVSPPLPASAACLCPACLGNATDRTTDETRE
ncbi:MAG: cysteine-rich CWC family protein [Sulfurifustis sp.]